MLNEVLLATLLLYTPLNLQVRKSSDHKEKGSVDLSEVFIIAPCETNHLSVAEVVDSCVDYEQDFAVSTVELRKSRIDERPNNVANNFTFGSIKKF